MSSRTRLTNFVILSAGVYLGFYVFGLVMGVFSPGEVPYFTIPAFVAVAMVIVAVVWRRRASSKTEDEGVTRAARHFRETRGF
jgi:hypothetical protein